MQLTPCFALIIHFNGMLSSPLPPAVWHSPANCHTLSLNRELNSTPCKAVLVDMEIQQICVNTYRPAHNYFSISPLPTYFSELFAKLRVINWNTILRWRKMRQKTSKPAALFGYIAEKIVCILRLDYISLASC